jgi:arylsulfatase A-like enzyme
MPRRPNIVLCLCDQLRAFEVGCYGNPVIRTPNLDGLATAGVRFETAVTSFPVCMAARSVTLSGQYNRTCTGGVGNVAAPMPGGQIWFPQYPENGRPHLPEPTLAEVLGGLGYYNAAVGKWHIHSWPQDLGFNDYVIPRMNHAHTAQLFCENGGPEFVAPGFSVDYECERVEALIQRRAGEEAPFFLYYNISPPHCPMSDAPERYLRMYAPEEIPLRPNVDLGRPLADQDHWFKVYRWDYRYYNHHLPYTEDLPADFTLQRVIAEYYGMTTWVDDAVGRMLAALDEAGLAQDTLVLFTSDHGDYLGSHGRVQKGDLHEESVRIPMLARWPGELAPGAPTEQVMGLVDVMPTVLGLLGEGVPAHVQGRDLSPVLRGEMPCLPGEEHAIIETGDGAGLRTPRHLYGLPFAPGTRVLGDAPRYVWDLTQDPYELDNLAGRGGPTAVVGELDGQLRSWEARTPWLAGS